jgi:hypothetical protein
MNKILFAGFILLCLSVRLFSQSAASSLASASIVEPITVTKTMDMDLGTVAIIIAGTVEMIPARINTRKPGIILPLKTGTFTAASFFLDGKTAYSQTITIPSSPLEIKSSGGTLVINSFTSDPIVNSPSGLSAGVYVSVTPLNLIVNYN